MLTPRAPAKQTDSRQQTALSSPTLGSILQQPLHPLLVVMHTSMSGSSRWSSPATLRRDSAYLPQLPASWKPPSDPAHVQVLVLRLDGTFPSHKPFHPRTHLQRLDQRWEGGTGGGTLPVCSACLLCSTLLFVWVLLIATRERNTYKAQRMPLCSHIGRVRLWAQLEIPLTR